MKLKLLIFYCVFALMSCNETMDVQINQELSANLVGEWRSAKVKIIMPSYKNTDSLKTFEVNESNWEARFKIQPIRTFFKLDGSYNSLHLNLKDSIILNPAGKWMVVGDSLHMMDTFPQRGLVYKYKLKLMGNTLELFGQEDCDNDGKVDDSYYGKQKRW
jgi:hypothetical protein